MNHHHDVDDHGGRRGRRSRTRGGGRIRRGDVRSALLIALLDGPAHGYELIQALEAKTSGRWRPSPGSVYPSLQLLADEGLVFATERDGRRGFELTEDGRATATARVESDGYPWDNLDDDGDTGSLRAAVRDLHLAARQIGSTGSPELVDRAA